MEDNKYLTPAEFQKRFSNIFRTRQSVYYAIRHGQLEHKRLGTKILIDVEAFLRSGKGSTTPKRPVLYTTDYDTLLRSGEGLTLIEFKGGGAKWES